MFFNRLDILLNNGGAIHEGPEKTEDGFLITVATNYLGPFLLTNLLLGKHYITNCIIDSYFVLKLILCDSMVMTYLTTTNFRSSQEDCKLSRG